MLSSKYIKIIKNEEFREQYLEIIKTMGFSEEEDNESRDLLKHLLSSRAQYSLNENLDYLKSKFENIKAVFIFGGGPDAKNFLTFLKELPILKKFQSEKILIIAVDGATELLSKNNLFPDIIFTDLDGITQDIVKKYPPLKNSIFIVHSHGDNMDKIHNFRDLILFHKYIIGTTQTNSKLPIINHGGFTDGDRSLFLIENFLKKSHKLFLIGFDFGNVIGQHSKPTFKDVEIAGDIKRKKLAFGRKLLIEVCQRLLNITYFVELEYPIHKEIQKTFNGVKIKLLKLNNSSEIQKILQIISN